MSTSSTSIFRVFFAVLVAVILLALSQSADSSEPASAQAIGGPVFVSGDDAEDHCAGTNCGGLMAAVLKSAVDLSLSPGTGIAAIGMEDPDNIAGLASWNDSANGGPDVAITVITEAEIPTVNFADFAVIFVPSNEDDNSGSDPVGIDDSELVALNARKADIVDFVNNVGGGLIALTEEDADPALAWGFFPLPLEIEEADYTQAQPTAALLDLAPAATLGNMTHESWHEVFTGPPGFSGLEILATAVDTEEQGQEGLPALLGGDRVILKGLITLTPETATNTVGEDHTVTANVTDGVDPVEGVEVTFVVTGQNDDSGSGTTDADGDATFTYTGDGGAGTDTIQACFTPAAEPTATATPAGTPTATATATATPTGTPAPSVEPGVLPPTAGESCATATKEWTAVVLAATATPKPTPVVLPTSGGTTSDGGAIALPWMAAIAGAIALIGRGSAWLAYQRRRVR